METVVNFLNNFIINALCYFFIIIIYGWAIYNIVKFIYYVLSTALAKIRNDINKWRSNQK